MVATIPPILIERPLMLDQPRYGLIQAAIGPLPLPVHARNGGIQYVHNECGSGFGYEINCLPDQAAKDFTQLGLSTVLGVPFLIYSTFVCGSVGYTEEEFQQFAIDSLTSVEQTVAEQVFSDGLFAQAPSLANNPDVVTLAGGGTTAVEVISELERAIYCTNGYGYTAFLHMPIPVFNELKREHLIEFDGKRWRTPMGSVVVGGCYSGNDPAGAAPVDGTFWVYATGQTVVWRTPDSELFIAPVEGTLDRTTNQQRMLVEREYVITFECIPYAKAVTLWT